ncbi:amidohydrolase family protein [Tahibacter harae]|uniref:Amidohydrolase family protein n=1 Tax=Tahibacter harae TaxID=2963937 RepID=A0ABT1QQF5_9GAMM|nr:amidohydrolase family protein [Tahibacter harae]MCQ4164533.1 amidohydrolase family protein [Tahibacter harae]
MLSRILAVLLLAAAGAVSAGKPAPEGTWLLTHVSVIPLDTDEVLQDQDVLIRQGRIASLTPAAEKLRVRGATVIDGRGKFLIPGLVDAHVHIATEGAIRDSKDARIAALPLGEDHAYDRRVLLGFLKAGVTGAANLGGSARSDEDLLWLRTEIAAGRIAGPRLYVGKRINGPRADVVAGSGEAPPSRPESPRTADDGAAAVRAAQQRGYDFIKPYQYLNRETYEAVVGEARRLRLPSTGHLPELGCARCADRESAFAHPLDNIAHAEELARYARSSDFAPRDIDALADEVAARGIGVTPTLITLKTIVHMYTQREVPAVPPGWLALVDPVTRRDWAPPANRYLSEAFRAQEGADTFSIGYDFARLLTRQLWRRGVPLTVGTDAALPGLAFGVSVQQEMFELREIGLSPREVLRAASLNAHRLFAPGSGEGPVRPGRRADLVLLEADPLADIRNVSRVAGVFVHGRWLPAAQIDALLAGLAPHDALLQHALQADGER